MASALLGGLNTAVKQTMAQIVRIANASASTSQSRSTCHEILPKRTRLTPYRIATIKQQDQAIAMLTGVMAAKTLKLSVMRTVAAPNETSIARTISRARPTLFLRFCGLRGLHVTRGLLEIVHGLAVQLIQRRLILALGYWFRNQYFLDALALI